MSYRAQGKSHIIRVAVCVHLVSNRDEHALVILLKNGRKILAAIFPIAAICFADLDFFRIHDRCRFSANLNAA